MESMKCYICGTSIADRWVQIHRRGVNPLDYVICNKCYQAHRKLYDIGYYTVSVKRIKPRRRT